MSAIKCMWWRILHNNYYLLLFLFLVSIGVRWTTIHRSLDYNSYVTAHALLTVRIWQYDSPAIMHFNPVYTLPGEANRGINNLGGIHDREGRYYYVSYPPFAFIFPFAIFHIGKIPADVLSLHWFNIILHGFSALGIYMVIAQLYGKKKGKCLPALAGSMLYLLAPANLWFHSAIYFVDVAAQPFFIFGIFLFYRSVYTKTLTPVLGLLLFLDIFIMTYTEWIGVLFVLVGVLYLLIFTKQWKRTVILVSLLSSAASLALCLTIWQYTQIAGFPALGQELLAKFAFRNGFSTLNWKLLENTAYFYYRYYLTIIILLFLFLILWFRKIGKTIRFFSTKEISLCFFSAAPVALHTILFLNFSSNHSFSTVKSSVFFSLIFGILFRRLFFTGRLIRASILTALLVVCSMQYRFQYPTAEGKNPYRDLGMYIRSTARPDEWVAVCSYPGGFIEPQVLWYAQRNIKSCADADDAGQSGIVFTVNERREVVHVERLSL